MATREILTFQFGHYSNFVGTHWWNIQELNFSYDQKNPSDINSDVLYREGETLKKETTFTPRLLLVDLKGTLGYLSKSGDLYQPPENVENETLWENIEIQKEEPEQKPSFIKSLDNPEGDEESEEPEIEQAEKWVDFLVPRFHPRTVTIVEEYTHASVDQPFDIFHLGQDLWSRSDFSDDFTNKIRQYVEECDLLQGFQVLLDSTDGFAGLASSCLEHLQDDYGKSTLAFPLIDSQICDPSSKDLIKSLNIALCWNKLTDLSSLYSPLSLSKTGWTQPGDPRQFSNLSYDINNRYQSSALLATALDTLTMRYRHKKHTMSALSDLCSDLNKLGRKAAATSLCLPFPMRRKKDLIDVLDQLEGDLWTSLTPCEISKDKSMQSLALRGVPEERLKRPMHEAKRQISLPAYRCSTVHEMMSLYLAASCYATATYLVTSEQPMKIKPPYPRIFNYNVYENGDVAEWPVGEEVKSVPVLAGMHSTVGLAQMFESLHQQVSRIKHIKRFNSFPMEQDEYVEIVNSLLDQKEAYEDHYV